MSSMDIIEALNKCDLQATAKISDTGVYTLEYEIYYGIKYIFKPLKLDHTELYRTLKQKAFI